MKKLNTTYYLQKLLNSMQPGKLPLIIALLSFICPASSRSQSGMVSSGGNGTGTGGTMSFTVGQTFDQYNSIPNYSIAEGVQQAFEIQVITNTKDWQLPFELSVFPNPSAGEIQIKAGTNQFQGLEAGLYDVGGHLILQQKITQAVTQMNLAQIPAGVYSLRIRQKYSGEQTFQIIKQ